MASLEKIVDWLERTLRTAEVTDFPNAWNGLQIENAGNVRKIAAAVDGCEFTIGRALEAGADLLLVHHGLFWQGVQPVRGANYRRLRAALAGDLAVYSTHLPLDLHPQLGNNALLALALGLQELEPFFLEKGQHIGWRGCLDIERDTLCARLEKAVGGAVLVCPGGPTRVRNLGIVTGGAGSEVARAAAEGVDTFVTGEAPHWAYAAAEELGVNLLLGGHYATETFGVKALAEQLSAKFEVPWLFIDHPTGL